MKKREYSKQVSGSKKRVTLRDDQDGDTPPTRSRSKRRKQQDREDNSADSFDFKMDEEEDERTGQFGAQKHIKKSVRIKEYSSGEVRESRSRSNTRVKSQTAGGLSAENLKLFDRGSSRSKSGGRKQKTVTLGRDITRH